MRTYIVLLLLFLMTSCGKTHDYVLVQTELGNITIEVFTKKAALTARNFLDNCKEGIYTDAIFYRVVNYDNQPDNKIMIDVIQGGLFHDSIVDQFPVIQHETTQTTGIKHLNGTISMARNEPGSASTEFFICVGDQPELDYKGKRNPDGQGFAAFGKVIDGMEVVYKIHAGQNTGQMLDKPVKILSIQEI